MLRKVLTLVMVFIFALSLLAVSMITCFTYDAEADDPVPDVGHIHYDCWLGNETRNDRHTRLLAPWSCTSKWMTVD